MAKISKIDAFKTMVECIEYDKNDIANEIFKIINRSQTQDKKNNVVSMHINLNRKEEKYFPKTLIITEEQE